jgi:hypothetical protein
VGAGHVVAVDDQDVALPLGHVGAFDHRLGHVRVTDHARGAERLHQPDALDTGGTSGGALLGGAVRVRPHLCDSAVPRTDAIPGRGGACDPKGLSPGWWSRVDGAGGVVAAAVRDRYGLLHL